MAKRISRTSIGVSWLRKSGHLAERVEHFNSFTKQHNDLFGFIDIMAVKGNTVFAIQVVNGKADAVKHLRKMKKNKAMLAFIAHGIIIVFHSWQRVRRNSRNHWTMWEQRIFRFSVTPWRLVVE